jgi:hypothetical protein
MKTRALMILLLTVPVVVRADPVMIDGQSLIAFAIVAFWALLIESGIVTLTLASTGILIVPSFITLALANVAVFLFVFLPLSRDIPVWILEPGVVLADAVAIKILTAAPFLQGGDFSGISWRRALTASLIGNAASFFIGVMGSHRPWEKV